MRAVGILLILLLAGCASGSGVKLWNPSTWFSHAPADKVDSTNAKEEAARHEAVKAAQRSAHQTGLALASAPPSRPVAVATDFNATTTALLDQAEGALEAGELARIKKTITGLLSENAAIREEAERQSRSDQQNIASISSKLSKAEAASDAAGKKLREAYDRENRLANEYRNLRFMFWGSCGMAVLLGVGWLYVRFALGGIPSAVGKGLSVLRAKNPTVADEVTAVLDGFLNRHEQDAIRKTTL